MAIHKSPSPSVSSSSGSSRPSSTSDFQWEEVSTEFTIRSVALGIYGDTDTGRTTLALSAPGPIAYVHAYEKVDGLINRMRQEKLIRQHKFGDVMRGNLDEIQSIAEEEMTKLETAISQAYSWARSIVMDTETAAWELAQLARLGTMTFAERDSKDQKKGQLVYQEINNRWHSILSEYRIQRDTAITEGRIPTNLIIISKTKEEYKKSKLSPGDARSSATGKTIRAGQKNTAFFCDVMIRTYCENQRFTAIVEKPWWNNAFREVEFSDELLNFPEIMGLITETSSDEWRK